MDNMINYFPSALLILMIALTLILLPLINEDRPRHNDQDQ